LDAEGKVEGFDKALVTNDITGGVMVAAANAVAKDVAVDSILFTLTVAEDATISIEATNLNNEAAGYLPTGEDIDLLIGAEGDTYPVMLAAGDVGTNVTGGTVAGPLDVVEGDASGDGVVNTTDIIAVINHIFDANVTLDDSGQKAADMNNDGIINTTDIIAIINAIFNP